MNSSSKTRTKTSFLALFALSTSAFCANAQVLTFEEAKQRADQKAAAFSALDKQRFIEEMFSLPGTIRGVNIIGASAGAQSALESDKWNNGVFTASFIEGLRDKKADWNEDGRITVSELKNYLGQRVSELTAGAQKPSVVNFEQDQDFDLLN